nr:recombinase family protein [Parafannyhessea umbonata]
MGQRFTINGLRSVLHNDAYIGVYKYAGHVIEGGMPAIIERDLFERVQRKFKENKRGGAPRRAILTDCDEDTPRFWLTGKLYCGNCGEPMWGISGTSKTGAKHYLCMQGQDEANGLSQEEHPQGRY